MRTVTSALHHERKGPSAEASLPRTGLFVSAPPERLRLCRSLYFGSAAGIRQRRLSGCQSCDRYTIGRTRNVVHAYAVAELDRARLTAMLAANADFEIRTRLSAEFDRMLDDLAYAVLIQNGKRVGLEDL